MIGDRKEKRRFQPGIDESDLVTFPISVLSD